MEVSLGLVHRVAAGGIVEEWWDALMQAAVGVAAKAAPAAVAAAPTRGKGSSCRSCMAQWRGSS